MPRLLHGEEDVVTLVSCDKEAFPVHAWLVKNASFLLADILDTCQEQDVKLSERSSDILLFLNALYAGGLNPPEGLELSGELMSFSNVAQLACIADKFNAPRLLKTCTNYMATTGIACLELAPSEQGMETALVWLKLAKRLDLQAVASAVAALLGRMFFVWNVKGSLKELSTEMGPDTFLEVVSNITGSHEAASQSTPSNSQGSSQDNSALEDVLRNQPRQAGALSHAFGAEPLLGHHLPNHNHYNMHGQLAWAQPLVQTGLW